MNMEPDWALWRSFAAVVRQGSLSAAAREIGLSQPTVGRHIEALEQTLGMTLFERTLAGLKPNETALRLFEPVETARGALAEAMLRAEGAQPAPGGTVRITASAVVSHYLLPPLLVPIRQRFPAIALELVASDSPENLLLREADIAIRMFRPTQLELITRRLGTITVIAAAHKGYLDRRGRPQRLEDLAGHDLVGFDRSDLIIRHAGTLGLALGRDDFALRTDNQTLMWELIRAGLGIGFAQAPLVAASPDVEPLLPALAVPPLEVWLTVHRELFTSHRIRAIYDALADALRDHIAA